MRQLDKLFETLDRYHEEGKLEYSIYSELFDKLEMLEKSVDQLFELTDYSFQDAEPFTCAVSFLVPDNNGLRAGTVILHISCPSDTKEAIFEIQKKIQKLTEKTEVAILSITKLIH